MQTLSAEHEAILGALMTRGLLSSAELQAVIGKSQPTLSRLIQDLSDRIVVLGRARSTLYGLPKSIHGLGAQHPLFWTNPSGETIPLGVLTLLNGDLLHIDSPYVQSTTQGDLPWLLAPLKAQGFLGRLHAQRLQASGAQGDPDHWNLEMTLFSALHLHDAAGAITVGDASVVQDGAQPASPPRLPAGGQALADALDALAVDVARTLPAGSSAGGEQPKFLAVLASGQHVLVKFSPPRGTPFGERWHDLLHAECLASHVLARHGVDVAAVRIVESPLRTYLISDRFDRIGERGRLHVVAIGDAHRAFVPSPRSDWSATAHALARQGRLSALDAARISALRAFGHLIGNTDMHAGNLALRVELQDLARGRFTLAPVYDMLPMRWRPNAAMGGAPDYAAFEPDGLSLSSAATVPAKDFWQQLETHDQVSRGLRRVAGAMVGRLGG